MNSSMGDRFISLSYAIECINVLSSDNFDDPLQGMLLISRIYPFRRIAKFEIPTADESRSALNERAANLLSYAWKHSRLEYYDSPSADSVPDGVACALQGVEIWTLGTVH